MTDRSEPDKLDPHVPPFVVAYTSAEGERRFMFAPDGLMGFTVGNERGHARVYRFRPDDVARLEGMDFAERLAYVANLDLDALTMIEERGVPREAFDPHQFALF